MPVSYILNQFGKKMGLDPADDNQRDVMLRFLNEAADEVYAQADVGPLVEQVFQVNGDQTISFPAYVGQLRAMREYYSQIPFHINQLRPRYNVQNWQDQWRNWRIKGIGPLMRSISNQANLTIEVSVIENPPIVVIVSGQTATATSITEQITMDAVSKTSANNYIDLKLLGKDRVNNVDVTVKDADGNTLTVIPNNMLEAMYFIVDVSILPWSNSATNPYSHYCEVLYKQALPWLQSDGDEFPAKGYDNVIVNKMIQLWAEEQEKPDLALAMDAKATRGIARKHEDQNRATEDVVSMVANPHDQLFARIRASRFGRYGNSIYPFGVQ